MEQKQNYQLQSDACINNLVGRPTLLLHSCCGPCSSYVIEYLSKYFELTVFFYNPNIHPETEYRKRLLEQKRLCEILGVPCVDVGYDSDSFFTKTNGYEKEKEGGARCKLCFELRLSKTAELAKNNGFEYFCSTLTVSPHKNAQLINVIGNELAVQYSVKWFPSDFKKRSGYLRSIELSKRYDLYRQDYCGCIYSKIKEED